jgi:putative FmdB family regulatory protein
MPLYEYSCTRCQKEFEFLVRGSEKAVCPECGSRALERLLSVPAAHTGSHSASLPICQTADSPCAQDASFCRRCQY